MFAREWKRGWPVTDPRSRNRYRQAQQALRAARLPCALCGADIDYTAKPLTRWSFSADHVVPLREGGDPYSPGNLQPAHYGCNSRKGAGIGVANRSRDW